MDRCLPEKQYDRAKLRLLDYLARTKDASFQSELRAFLDSSPNEKQRLSLAEDIRNLLLVTSLGDAVVHQRLAKVRRKIKVYSMLQKNERLR